MPDPRAKDPRFPDRPTHPDFIRLSEAVQNHDAMTEQLDVNPFAVVGIDEESFTYFLKNRMGVVSQRMHRDFTHPRFMALYMDAFALGKRYAEMVTEGDDQDHAIIAITPTTLREIADDLEREGHGFCRTVETTSGVLVDLELTEDYEEEDGS